MPSRNTESDSDTCNIPTAIQMKRIKETVIGLSFIAAIALLFAGISFLKGRNIWSNKAAYYVRYNNVTGLSDASPIYTNGVRIGIVDNIHYNYKKPDDIIVRILVDRRLQIPEGSVALLETELLGSVNVNLMLASYDSPTLAPGDTLVGKLNKGIMAEVADVMPALMNTVHKADTLLASAQTLFADSSVTNILHNTEDITTETKKKLHELSGLMNEISTMANTYNRMGEHLDTLTGELAGAAQTIRDEEWMKRFSQVLANLETLSSQLVDDKGTAGKIITDPHLYNNLDETCTEARKLIEDIRQNPGRYIRIFGKREP